MEQGSQLEDRLGQRFGALDVLLETSHTTRHAWTEEFVKRYTEPHRHYHTITHIDAMLTCYDQATLNDEAVLLAIFFHDWVYDPLRSDNEVESARVFKEFAQEVGVAAGLKQKVTGLIEATIKHTLQNEDDGTKLFLDFDLEVLSRPPEGYEVYAKQIREEYIHYDDEAYRKGRASVLENFLRRDRIYFSEVFSGREQAARDNIQAEIMALKN